MASEVTRVLASPNVQAIVKNYEGGIPDSVSYDIDQSTQDVFDKIHGYLLEGNSIKDSCSLAGISVSCFYLWCKRYASGDARLRDFFERCEFARATVRRKLVSVVMAAAEGTLVGDPKMVAIQVKTALHLLSVFDRETWSATYVDGYNEGVSELLERVRERMTPNDYHALLRELGEL